MIDRFTNLSSRFNLYLASKIKQFLSRKKSARDIRCRRRSDKNNSGCSGTPCRCIFIVAALRVCRRARWYAGVTLLDIFFSFFFFAPFIHVALRLQRQRRCGSLYAHLSICAFHPRLLQKNSVRNAAMPQHFLARESYSSVVEKLKKKKLNRALSCHCCDR